MSSSQLPPQWAQSRWELWEMLQNMYLRVISTEGQRAGLSAVGWQLLRGKRWLDCLKVQPTSVMGTVGFSSQKFSGRYAVLAIGSQIHVHGYVKYWAYEGGAPWLLLHAPSNSESSFLPMCSHSGLHFSKIYSTCKELFKEHRLWEMFYEESPVLESKDFGICCILYHLL